MAEKTSHDVVDNTGSASASAPADVAANQTTTASAADGTNPTQTTNNATATTTTDTTTDAAAATDSNAVAESRDVNRKAADANSTTQLALPDGESKELTNGTLDTASQSGSHLGDVSVEPSVASDTEGTRSDAPGQKSTENHHTRTNSVKKPTTFSKVSVTKNFLAKAASPSPTATAAKLGEKPSPLNAPSQPAAARPRLVAKTASSSQSMQRPRVGESAGAPDASKVWNKNRPVAPPPPKTFTDEELKQQYGIHLATRLQSDENGKENKWADIDEDEEDWAPEAVVWMDGTKSSLTPSEPAPAAKDEKPATPQQQPPAKPAEGAKPTLTIKKAADSGPPKTILKPGIAAQQAKQASQSAAASPAGDKAILKTKSPAPAPAKSPWAQLPPVQSFPPVNPPTQQAPPSRSTLPPQDARAYDQGPPSAPAPEMPADTFDRSWPGGEVATRELFNSTNGRYEPAPEHRRGSMRQTGSFARPALLQKPSQQGQDPAEPSPAFQTRRESQTDGAPWTRRRGSSVGQASGPIARRASVSRPTDLPPAIEDERRSSTVIGQDMRAQQGPPNGRPNFNQQSAWDQQMPTRSDAAAPQAEPVEDPVKVQERIMKEKREEARKRKIEQDQQAEQEKQERLKAKMAALAGVGKSRAEREAEAAAAKAAALASPVAEKAAQGPAATTAAKKEERPAAPAKAAEVSAEVGSALEAQSLSPAPPMNEQKLPSPLPRAPAQPASLPERPVSAEQQQAPKPHLSPRAPARAPFGQQSPYRPAVSAYSSPGDRKQQPFGRSPLAGSEALPGLGWNPPASNGNVWGTSGIGNGTFDKASSFAPMPMSAHQGSALPPPPGMSRPTTATRISPQGLAQDSRSPSLAPQQSQEQQQQRAFPTPPGIDGRAESGWGISRNAGPSPVPNVTRQPHAPGPIAPPTRAQLQQQAAQRPDAISAWKAAADRLPNQYEADADAASRRPREPQVMPPPRDAVIKETFKKTSADQGRLGGPRRFDNTEYLVHDAQGTRSVPAHSPAPPSTQTQPIAPPPAASSSNERPAPAENTVRIPDGSRNPAHGGFAQELPIAAPNMSRQCATVYQGSVNFPTGPLPGVLRTQLSDKTPPPPETDYHPAFTGNARRPVVKLPHPAPRVKLPPASTQGPPQLLQQQSGVSMPRRHQVPGWGPPGVGGPIVQNAEWQARFNGLFQRTSVSTEIPPSPPKTPPKMQGPALAVTSSSRADMDELTPNKTATVSLPASPPRPKNVTAFGFTIDNSSSTTSKPTIDHVFTEELGFGSRPTIRIPRNPAYGPEMYNEPDFNLLRAPPTVKVSLAIDPQTMLPLPPNWWPRNAQGIFVKLHGTKGEKRNMLVKYANVPKRVGSGSALAPQRKPSALVANAKGKGSGPGTPTMDAGQKNAASAAGGSKQASFQRSAAPSPGNISRQASGQKEVATASQASIPPTAATAAPVAAGNENAGRKRGGWHRAPRSRAAPAKAA